MPNSVEPTKTARAEAGARNLLVNCVGLAPGDRVLIVEETHGLGYFDEETPRIVEREARRLDAEVLTMTIGRRLGPGDAPEALVAAMGHVDHTVFISRIGDQMRYTGLPGSCSKSMIYTLDSDALASPAARLDHRVMFEVQRCIQDRIDRSREWHITCPLGTDVSGTTPEAYAKVPQDFLIRLFPISVFRPIPCRDTCGRIALARWVTGTNTHVYEPEVLRLGSPVRVDVENGRVSHFSGEPEVVADLERHCAMVGEKLGTDPRYLHSWHAGLNPGTYFGRPAAEDPLRWNGMVYGHPRHLHFHTCGDYAPGEISWHLLDATIAFDGEVLWRDGRLILLEGEEIRALLRRHGVREDFFANYQDIGVQGLET